MVVCILVSLNLIISKAYFQMKEKDILLGDCKPRLNSVLNSSQSTVQEAILFAFSWLLFIAHEMKGKYSKIIELMRSHIKFFASAEVIITGRKVKYDNLFVREGLGASTAHFSFLQSFSSVFLQEASHWTLTKSEPKAS